MSTDAAPERQRTQSREPVVARAPRLERGMDAERFDSLTRTLTDPASRRSLLRGACVSSAP